MEHGRPKDSVNGFLLFGLGYNPCTVWSIVLSSVYKGHDHVDAIGGLSK